jgi:hypothetical protein
MAGPTLKPSTFAPKKLARIIHERAAAGLAAPSKAVPAHPPLSAPKHGGGHCSSSEKYSHLPAPKKERQAAGWAGGRDLPLERRTGGQGALARASHNSCAEDIGRPVPLAERTALPESACWPHSLPYCWGVYSCQRTLAVFVALEELPHPPAPCCRCQSTLARRVSLKQKPHPPAQQLNEGRAAINRMRCACHAIMAGASSGHRVKLELEPGVSR